MRRPGGPVAGPRTAVDPEAQPCQTGQGDDQDTSAAISARLAITRFLRHRVSQAESACAPLPRRQSVDRVAKRQSRLRTRPSDSQRRGGVGPRGRFIERSSLGEGDRQRTIERIAGADRVDGLDPRRGDQIAACRR